MRVLFSAIGSTDPISNCHDGGMLHICRVYQPDKVYLYLSKEMCQYHEWDDRYCQSIKLLGQDLNWNCEIEVICDKGMEKVQLFDAFIDSFEKILNEIRKKDFPEEILVNVSSGTPAMKSSLQMLSILQNDIVAVQVSTPEKSSNKYHEDKDNYDLEVQWECNADRESGFENRCIVSDAKRLVDRVRKENIQKYIKAYDYEAAKMMAETLYQQPSEEFVRCLNIAIARKRLKLEFVNMNRKKYAIDAWFPIIKDRDMKEFEYLLSMQTKLWKKQYVDFVRDITPIFYSLSERVLKKYCNLEFQDIGEEKNKCWFLSIEKLKSKRIEPEWNWRNTTNISAYSVMKIMTQLCADEKILTLMQEIRKVEKEVRHLAAHDIVGGTDEWIQKRTGFTSKQVMDKVFELAKYSGMNISKKDRDIYNFMNDQLIKMLDN